MAFNLFISLAANLDFALESTLLVGILPESSTASLVNSADFGSGTFSSKVRVEEASSFFPLRFSIF